MNNRKWMLWVIAMSLGAGALALYLLLPHEPDYQGKGLSAWLQDFESNQPEAQALAADALRHMGAKAVPALVMRLHSSTIRKNSALWRFRQRVLELLSSQSLLKIPTNSPAVLRRSAFAGLDALGPKAKGALPVLEELLHGDTPDSHALYIVARIGPDGLPLLRRSLTNEHKVIRLGAGVCLDMIKSHSDTLYPKEEPGDAYSDFRRRISQFNLKILRAASEMRRAQHPELSHQWPGSDGRPPPMLPPEMMHILTNGAQQRNSRPR